MVQLPINEIAQGAQAAADAEVVTRDVARSFRETLCSYNAEGQQR
jgi:hypothetical protein